MARLVLINGAPGVGKSTIARQVAQHTPLALPISFDLIKRSLGRWHDDPSTSARHARALVVAMIRGQLASGHDVLLGQTLTDTDFYTELMADAAELGAEFSEVVLVLPADQLRERLTHRAVEEPHSARPETGPDDAQRLADLITALLISRPQAERVDASGSVADVVGRVLIALDPAHPDRSDPDQQAGA